MKKIVALLFLLSLLHGAGKYLSPVPLPRTYFIDLDIYPCDQYCLKDHLEHGEIFSFLAKAKGEQARAFAKEIAHFAALFRMQTAPLPLPRIQIAIIAETKLHRLANRCAKTLYTTLIDSQRPFTIRTLSTEADLIPQRMLQLEPDTFVILLLSYNNAHVLQEIDAPNTIFVPTLNKRLLQESVPYYFGGIDYDDQIRTLTQRSDNEAAIFYISHLPLSQKLAQLTLQYKQEATLIDLAGVKKNFKHIFAAHPQIRRSDAILHTPTVTTALTLSQLTLYGYAPPLKLSTQINFTPKIFDLTQPRDRKNLIIANAIVYPPSKAVASLNILDINLYYDWLSYALVIATEALLVPDMKESVEGFVHNQIAYDTVLMEATPNGFIPLEPPKSREEFLPDDSL